MDRLMVFCWLALAAIHVSPAAVLFKPELTVTSGSSGVLIIHRGALFLAIVALCLFAAFAPEFRKAASLTVGISVVGFLAVFLIAGSPSALRTIAIMDAVAVLPLAVIAWGAWRTT